MGVFSVGTSWIKFALIVLLFVHIPILVVDTFDLVPAPNPG